MTFYSANVRHAIYIERYKARVAREIAALVNSVSNDLFTYIAASDLENMTRRELDRLLVQVRRIVNDGYGEITPRIADALEQFAVYEAEWTASAVTRAGLVTDMGVPSDADLWAAMYARPFQGRLLRDWLTSLPANTAARVRQTIRQGYVDGLGSTEIARQIRGTRSRQGVMDISRRGAEAMVRTAVAHTSSRARDLTYEANGVKYVQEVSVLDGRTSAQCRGLDGKIWRIGSSDEKRNKPPGHLNCRRTRIPVTPGNRVAVQTRPTYNDWLTTQPESVQDDILGPTRAQLFREGNYTVDRFVDQSGQEYTLDQLRQRDSATFDEVFSG
jgi:SPP1 gp7 family putative phage head morphogenesis protein